jgi:hypothetical protein
MLRICLFSRSSFLLLCGIESPLTLLKGSNLQCSNNRRIRNIQCA